MGWLKGSYITRAFALVSLLLIAYAQLRAPAGDPDAPLNLMTRFIYFPAGWSLSIFLMIALPMRERLKLAGALAAAALAGAAAGFALASATLEGAMIGFGLAPYLFALAGVALHKGEARQEWIDMLALGSLIHITALAIPYFRDRTALDLPFVVDHQLATWDEAFGVQISSVMALALHRLPTLYSAAAAAYALVQIPIVVIAAVCWSRRETRDLCVLPVFMIASIIGFFCYHLAPAIGPTAYFAGAGGVLHATPELLASLPNVDFDPHHPRNSMPSLHFTWALLVFLFSRGLPLPARAAAATFMGLTVCATLGFREHWFVDLVVALPLTLLVRSLCAFELNATDPARRSGIILGAAMLSLWIGLIVGGVELRAPLVLALSVVTSAISLTYESQLARAGRRNAAVPAPSQDAATVSA